MVISPFLLFSFAAFLFSTTKNVGLAEITMELSLLLLLAVLTTTKLPSLTNILCPVIFLQFGISAYQYLFGADPRAYGSFQNWHIVADHYPNALGLFAIMIIPLLFHKKFNWFEALLLVMAFLTLIFSYSRGAALALALGLAVLTVFHLFGKKYKIIIKNLFCLLVALLIFGGFNFARGELGLSTNNFLDKAVFSGTEKITSVDERTQFLTTSFKLVPGNFWFGSGPGSFPYIFPRVQEIPFSGSPHPHNWLLKILVERGFLALSAFLIIAGFILVNFRHDLGRKLPYLVSLFVAFIHNSFDFNFNFILNWSVLVLILGCVLGESRNREIKRYQLPVLAVMFVILSFLTFSLASFQFQFAGTVRLNDADRMIVGLKNLDYLDSTIILAEIYEKKGEFAEAIAVLQNHLLNNRHDYFAMTKLAYLYLASRDFENALKYFQMAIELNGKNLADPYRGLLIAVNSFDPKLMKVFQERVMVFLREFDFAASRNLHFLAQSRQIAEAKDICDLLLKNRFVFGSVEILAIKKSLENAAEKFSSDFSNFRD